jgi:hypothetical protein
MWTLFYHVLALLLNNRSSWLINNVIEPLSMLISACVEAAVNFLRRKFLCWCCVLLFKERSSAAVSAIIPLSSRVLTVTLISVTVRTPGSSYSYSPPSLTSSSLSSPLPTFPQQLKVTPSNSSFPLLAHNNSNLLHLTSTSQQQQ